MLYVLFVWLRLVWRFDDKINTKIFERVLTAIKVFILGAFFSNVVIEEK